VPRDAAEPQRRAQPASPAPIACRDLSFAYETGGSAVPAVRGVTTALVPGTGTALLGPTGAGKSTLLQLLRGLLKPDAGAVLLDGLEPGSEGYEARRRRVGLVFQTPEVQLFAATARDDVAFGPRRLGWGEARVLAAVDGALETVGLPAAEFGGRHPYSLSGGEQRRLALAGVLAMEPAMLLLDEPFVSLDPAGRRDLAAVLGDLLARGVGFVLATHDVDRAWALCERRLILADGALVEDGPWRMGAGDEERLAGLGMESPFVVRLWHELGRPAAEAPRTVSMAAEALA
jgi:energy-coupling factor transport system ATP-binding protein